MNKDKYTPIGSHESNPFPAPGLQGQKPSPAPVHCKHKFVHLETKKVRGERPSWGYSPAVDWERIDVFYCERCCEQRVVTKIGPWIEHKDHPPEWW